MNNEEISLPEAQILAFIYTLSIPAIHPDFKNLVVGTSGEIDFDGSSYKWSYEIPYKEDK